MTLKGFAKDVVLGGIFMLFAIFVNLCLLWLCLFPSVRTLAAFIGSVALLVAYLVIIRSYLFGRLE